MHPLQDQGHQKVTLEEYKTTVTKERLLIEAFGPCLPQSKVRDVSFFYAHMLTHPLVLCSCSMWNSSVMMCCLDMYLWTCTSSLSTHQNYCMHSNHCKIYNANTLVGNHRYLLHVHTIHNANKLGAAGKQSQFFLIQQEITGKLKLTTSLRALLLLGKVFCLLAHLRDWSNHVECHLG